MAEPRQTTSSNSESIQALQNGSLKIRDLIDERTAQAKADVEALKELILEKFGGVEIRFDAQREALLLAHAEAEKNYHNLNNLREGCISTGTYDQGHKTLADKIAIVELTMVSRESAIQSVGVHGIRLDVLERAASKAEGKASNASVVGAYVVAVMGWLVSPLIALAIERLVMK